MTHIEVNYAGMTALAGAVDRQEQFVRRTAQVVTDGCGDFGAFWGFMEVFQGAYEEAHGHVLDGLEDSRLCAAAVAETIRHNRDTYQDRDIAASTSLSGIDVTVTRASTTTIGPGGTVQTPGAPVVTTEEKNVAGLAGLADDIADQVDVDTAATGGRGLPANHGLTASPTSVIALAGEFQDTVQAGQDAQDAQQDTEDYEDFEEQNR